MSLMPDFSPWGATAMAGIGSPPPPANTASFQQPTPPAAQAGDQAKGPDQMNDSAPQAPTNTPYTPPAAAPYAPPSNVPAPVPSNAGAAPAPSATPTASGVKGDNAMGGPRQQMANWDPERRQQFMTLMNYMRQMFGQSGGKSFSGPQGPERATTPEGRSGWDPGVPTPETATGATGTGSLYGGLNGGPMGNYVPMPPTPPANGGSIGGPMGNYVPMPPAPPSNGGSIGGPMGNYDWLNGPMGNYGPGQDGPMGNMANPYYGWMNPDGTVGGGHTPPAPSIPTYTGPPIPSLTPTLNAAQPMATVMGMRQSPNPTMQNMAPLLMQQLMAQQAQRYTPPPPDFTGANQVTPGSVPAPGPQFYTPPPPDFTGANQVTPGSVPAPQSWSQRRPTQWTPPPIE